MQMLAYIHFQIILDFVLFLRRLQTYLACHFTLGPWLLFTMQYRNENIFDYLIAFLSVRVVKYEDPGIRDVLLGGRPIQQHPARVVDRR